MNNDLLFNYRNELESRCKRQSVTGYSKGVQPDARLNWLLIIVTVYSNFDLRTSS